MKVFFTKISMLLLATFVIASPAVNAAALTNGQTVTGLGAAQNTFTADYYIDVPSGASNLKISIAPGTGSTGDADLFVKKGSEPTDSSYDCRPWDNGSTETCGTGGDALATSVGRFHIKLRAYSTFSNVNLTASYTGGGSSSGGSSSGGSSSGGSSSGGSSSGGSSSGGSSSGGSSSGGSSSGGLSNGQTVTGLGAAQGQRTANYYIDVPSGATNLKIEIAAGSGSSGDADLYVKKGSVPTDSSYDCRPYKSGSAEICGTGGTALATSAGRFHINLKAYSTFTNVNLTASYTAGGSSSGGSSSGGSSSGGSSSGGSSSGGSSSGGSSSGGSSSGGTIANACATEGAHTASAVTMEDVICLKAGTSTGSIAYHYVNVPASTPSITIRTAHGTGNGNLYYNASTWATATANTQSSTNSGNTESITVSNPASGYRFFSVVGQQSGMALLVSTNSGGSSSGGSSSGGSSSGGSSSGGSSSGGSSSGGMTDVCASGSPTEATALEDGVPVCVKATSQFTSFSIAAGNPPNRATSIAITTSYGLGNLTLEGRAHGTEAWPKIGDDSVRSSHVGNTECIIITNIDRYWANITLRGLFKGVTVVADLNKTTCRATPGAVDIGNTGYKFNNIHVVIFPIRFPSVDLAFTNAQITTEMNKVKTYFTEQSYGKFNVTWEIKPKITMDQSKSTFDNDKPKWNPAYKAKILAAGTDPDFPGDAKIVMMTAPPIGTEATNYINSQAGPPLMEIYTYKAGTIAHEMGHALGLHHAKSLEGGNATINGNTNDVVTDYGNVFTLMGMGAHTLEEMNLMYKSYFKGSQPWFSDSDVPLVSTSGTYRIYAYDHGTASGHGAPGAIGIRLKSGDGKVTYWVEYLTSQLGRPDRDAALQNGILVNIQGYKDDNVQPWWNHTSVLLDMKPNSLSGTWALEDFLDSYLDINASYTDRLGNAFRITPMAKGGTPGTPNAWIDVKVEKF